MAHDPHPNDAAPVGVGSRLVDGGTPAAAVDAPRPLDIEIRNLRGGQTIQMDVRGAWTEDELEVRLLRFVAVRQPAALHVNLEAPDEEPEPRLLRVRAAIEDVGGTLTVGLVPSPAAGG